MVALAWPSIDWTACTDAPAAIAACLVVHQPDGIHVLADNLS